MDGALEGLDQPRHRSLAVVEHDRVDGGARERRRIGGGRVTADDDRYVGRDSANPSHELQHVVGLERMHRRDADEIRTRIEVVLDRTAETQIDERDLVPARLERGGDVFHAERFDAEERSETEALVSGNGTKQQDSHGRVARVTQVLYSAPDPSSARRHRGLTHTVHRYVGAPSAATGCL